MHFHVEACARARSCLYLVKSPSPLPGASPDRQASSNSSPSGVRSCDRICANIGERPLDDCRRSTFCADSVVSNGSSKPHDPGLRFRTRRGRPFLLCFDDWTTPGSPIIVNRLDSSSGSSLDGAKLLIEVLLRLALSLFLCV